MFTSEINCPYCGESISISVDDSVKSQRYIEDCEVCCRPIQLEIFLDEDGTPVIEAQQEDEV